ncbi:hypothetical protein B0H14DRAFT_2558937 [Mycena olivaceomarginata]|nr:hypothetical protein B0H14DRAFT_2558937 [Mycena olivaceomarginata]
MPWRGVSTWRNSTGGLNAVNGMYAGDRGGLSRGEKVRGSAAVVASTGRRGGEWTDSGHPRPALWRWRGRWCMRSCPLCGAGTGREWIRIVMQRRDEDKSATRFHRQGEGHARVPTSASGSAMSSPRVRDLGVRKRRTQCVRVRVMLGSTVSGTILSRESKDGKEERRTGEDPEEEEEIDDDVLLFEARDRYSPEAIWTSESVPISPTCHSIPLWSRVRPRHRNAGERDMAREE